jgi:hypothetical protein
MSDEEFIEEAVRRVEEAGMYPALGQRKVDWSEVKLWSERVAQQGFKWLTEAEQQPYGGGDIIVSINGAICSGQHRILGGLMGDNPVPETSISRMPIHIDTQAWK